MSRYRLAAVLLLLLGAQLALAFAYDRQAEDRLTNGVGQAVVAVILLYFLLRGTRWVYFLLLFVVAASTVFDLGFALFVDHDSALYLANAFLNVASGVIIWMIWEETVALQD